MPSVVPIFVRQPVGEEARPDVDAGTGAERNDEPDRPRRPSRRLRFGRRCDGKYAGNEGKRK